VSEPAKVIGVLGAGTMGAGIAELAARAGARTLLFDPVDEALAGGMSRIAANLDRQVQRGRLDVTAGKVALASVQPIDDVGGLADAELVIEAAPERLALKHELLSVVAAVAGGQCVLASNTSSLLVTAIAAGVPGPERVVGMHFFNPPPVMKLLEVVAGEQSDERSLAVARATGEAMGKQVILATDGPGFLVNRCNRPFGLEALRLWQERIASFDAVDRIMRMGGGFRMGPFELMDLVGIDVGLEISKSFYEQSFGEPRWRPSMISARYVAAGRHGRKSGRGYYEYGEGSHRPDDPEPPAPGGGDGLIAIIGESVISAELTAHAREAGWQVSSAEELSGEEPYLTIDCGSVDEEELFDDQQLEGPRATLCDVGSLAVLDPGGDSVGFHLLPPLAETRLVELTKLPTTDALAVQRAERFFASLGLHAEWVGDAPGLGLGRIVCQLINEAAFALGEGVGSPDDIDTGMVLGLNHPRGPLAWADAIGLDHVLAVLDGLSEEYREERYRPAPALRQTALAGRLGRHVGAGFHSYD